MKLLKEDEQNSTLVFILEALKESKSSSKESDDMLSRLLSIPYPIVKELLFELVYSGLFYVYKLEILARICACEKDVHVLVDLRTQLSPGLCAVIEHQLEKRMKDDKSNFTLFY